MLKIFLNLPYVSFDDENSQMKIVFYFLVKKYFFVLTWILNETKENLIGLYLYPDKEKNPYKVFSLDKDDQYRIEILGFLKMSFVFE